MTYKNTGKSKFARCDSIIEKYLHFFSTQIYKIIEHIMISPNSPDDFSMKLSNELLSISIIWFLYPIGSFCLSFGSNEQKLTKSLIFPYIYLNIYKIKKKHCFVPYVIGIGCISTSRPFIIASWLIFIKSRRYWQYSIISYRFSSLIGQSDNKYLSVNCKYELRVFCNNTKRHIAGSSILPSSGDLLLTGDLLF